MSGSFSSDFGDHLPTCTGAAEPCQCSISEVWGRKRERDIISGIHNGTDTDVTESMMAGIKGMEKVVYFCCLGPVFGLSLPVLP